MWIDTTDSETAAALETRLNGTGAKVHISNNAATSIAYSAYGLNLRQKEETSVWEFRSLTERSAEKLASLSSDSTTTSIYYKPIAESGEYAAVAIRTGTKTEYVPTRANEADGWHVIKTVSTLSAASSTGWSTNRPSVSSTGIVISETNSSEFLASGIGNISIFQHTSTIIREYPFLTYSEARLKLAYETQAGSRVGDVQIATQWSTDEGITAWRNVTVRGGTQSSTNKGTDKSPTMRYDGPERGWVVTVVETTYWTS